MTNDGPDRRRVLKAIGGSVLVTGLAGCSDDGPDESTPNGEDDGESEFVQESMGSVGRNDIDELEIVGWESETLDTGLNVHVSVRNNGDQQVDAYGYTFQITPYDEDGTEIETSGTSKSNSGESQISPGGVGSIQVMPLMDADPETVASYEVLLHCDGPLADGVYC